MRGRWDNRSRLITQRKKINCKRKKRESFPVSKTAQYISSVIYSAAVVYKNREFLEKPVIWKVNEAWVYFVETFVYTATALMQEWQLLFMLRCMIIFSSDVSRKNKKKKTIQNKTKQNSGHCYRMMQSALTVNHCYDRRKSFFSPCLKSWSGDIDMKIKKIHSIQKNDYVIHSICYNVMGNTFNDGLGEQYAS